MVNFSRSAYRYQSSREIDEPIVRSLKELAENQSTWGVEKMTDLIRQSHPGWNHKRIRRIYCELGLNLRVKRKKRLPSRDPQPLTQPERPNQSWPSDAYVFQSLDEVRELVESWMETYNSIRPHDALQGLSPYQFAQARG
jgi:transposase InsO family protein